MTRFTDEELSSYVDGSADPDVSESIEAMALIDVELRMRLNSMRNNDRLLRAAFDDALETDPRPMVFETASLRSRKTPIFQHRPQIPVWRLAVALALSVFAGWAIATAMGNSEREPIKFNAAGLFAQIDLSHALSNTPSGTSLETPEGSVQLQETFVSSAGEFCRQFSLTSAEQGAAGVACRRKSGWQIEGWIAEPANSAHRYPGDAAMAAVKGKLGVKEQLNRSRELTEIEHGWE